MDVEQQNTEQQDTEQQSSEQQDTEQQSIDVPEKFLVNGEPDVTKIVKSYTDLEKKLHSGYTKQADSPDSYNFDFGDVINVDEDRAKAFKEIAFDLGLSQGQYETLMNTYVDEYQRMTRPEGAASIEDLTAEEESFLDQTSLSGFKEKAVELGLTNEQYQFVLAEHTKAMEASNPQQDTQEVLSEVWGENMNTELSFAEKAAEKFGDIIPMELVKGNPGAIMALAILGKELGEDTPPGVFKNSAAPMVEADIYKLMRSGDYWDNPGKQKQAAEYFKNT